jgi:DNA-binding LytR/AlgR family response regulator
MKTIIIEDEKPARQHLESLLRELVPNISIEAQIDSVKKAVEWLSSNKTDLIFLDIHLADDISFKIFEQIEVKTPIIFTTAYDQYALKAFKVNSVDFLLKPIDKNELSQSIRKFNDSKMQVVDIQQIINSFQQQNAPFQERFLVNKGEKVMSITTDAIAYFEGEDRYVYLVRKDGMRFIIDYKLSDLETLLNPKEFFRLNRSFITHFSSIKDILNVSKSRVKISLEPVNRREIIVSSENTQDFKKWLNQ